MIEQCRVVAHLATALVEIHKDKAGLFETGRMDELVEMIGRNTASYMETLGEMLNGMDAVTDDDDWTAPVFREAQRLWPTDAGFQSAV